MFWSLTARKSFKNITTSMLLSMIITMGCSHFLLQGGSLCLWPECGCHLPYNNPPPPKSYGDPVYTITHLPTATPSCRGGHPRRQWIRKFPAHTIAPPPKRSHCQKRKANFVLRHSSNFDKDREPTILCPDPCR